MPFSQTKSGTLIDLDNTDPNSIRLDDISHGLSMQARFHGQINVFYSVADHCVWCAEQAENDGHSRGVSLACLLHDSAEAYLGDLSTPIKHGYEFGSEYRKVESRLLDVIYKKLTGARFSDLPQYVLDSVSRYDKLALITEIEYFSSSSHSSWLVPRGNEKMRDRPTVRTIHDSAMKFERMFCDLAK